MVELYLKTLVMYDFHLLNNIHRINLLLEWMHVMEPKDTSRLHSKIRAFENRSVYEYDNLPSLMFQCWLSVHFIMRKYSNIVQDNIDNIVTHVPAWISSDRKIKLKKPDNTSIPLNCLQLKILQITDTKCFNLRLAITSVLHDERFVSVRVFTKDEESWENIPVIDVYTDSQIICTDAHH